jgi:hypothetical protein
LLNRDDIKKGDVLVYKGNGPIGMLAKGDEHVSTISDITKCDGHVVVEIIEAHLDTTDDEGKKVTGILKKTLNIKWDDIIDNYRLINEVSESEMDAAIKRVKETLVGKKQYDWLSFPRVWFWSVVLKPLGLGNIKPLFHSAHAEICSTWIQEELYNKFLGIDLFPDLDNTVGIPNDYRHSPLMRKVSS